MAEVVHRNLEFMLPQLEELEASGIFSHEEIKLIVKRRRTHEYKLMRRPAKKEDFLAAVQYEVHLDQLRQHRKKKLGISTTKQDAEYGIQSRIHSLFNRALKKFKGDLKLWLQHIEFSKQCGHKVSLSKSFGRALAVHPNEPGLWVMAAKFEFEGMKDISSARVILQQGLRANPQSRHLWIECFRMELLHTDKVKKRRAVLGLGSEETEEPSSDEFLANKAASIVYKQAVRNISDDVEFRLSFLPIYRLFADTDILLEEVYKDVQCAFPLHSLTWEALARRHWEEVNTTSLTDTQVEDLEDKTERIFREGISDAASSDCAGDVVTTQHWNRYIQWCMERVQDCSLSDRLKKKAVHRMLTAFKESSESGKLSEAKYEEYVNTLLKFGLESEAVDVSGQATIANPKSVDLWLQRLKCVHLIDIPSSNTNSKVREICEEALKSVPKEISLPIWQSLINHTIENRTDEEYIQAIFQRGLDSGVPAVLKDCSGKYLVWAYAVGGISKARTVYRRLLKERIPVPCFLYEQCIDVERKHIGSPDSHVSDLRPLRELYKQALDDYGSSHIDMWLGCVQMELSLPGGQLDKVGNIHWKAVKELNSDLTADFIARYSLMQNKTS